MIEWVHKNLFRTWFDGFISIFLTTTIIWLVSKLINWGVIHAVWTAESLEDCQNIMAGASGACWAIFNGHVNLFLFGFYPEEYYWRPILAFVLLPFALMPILFPAWRRKTFWFSGVYPFIAFALIWGAFGLEPVEPARFGGFMIVLILGVASLGLAITAGVTLALGQLYGFLITRILCSATICIFGGVPILHLIFAVTVFSLYAAPIGYFVYPIVSVIIVIGLAAAAKIAMAIVHEVSHFRQGYCDAARALGMSRDKAFWLISFPHACKRSVPKIAGEAAEIFQNTAIAGLVVVFVPNSLINNIRSQEEWNPIVWEPYIGVGLIYWVISFSIISYAKFYAKKLKQEEGVWN